MNLLKSRHVLILTVLLVVLAVYWTGSHRYFSLVSMQQHLDQWRLYTNENFIQAVLLFFMVYVASTALSIPGASTLTLLGGALFGVGIGFVVVSLASTVGATIAFLATRYVFRDWVEKKFPEKIKTINQGIVKDGTFYLLSLRLVPAVPFFLVNVLMGLTQISVLKYFLVSQIGMVPGTWAYVLAGKELGNLRSSSDLLSPSLIMAFTVLSLIPWVAKQFLYFLNQRRTYKKFKKPSSFDYNLIVIGGGAAGLVTSYIASAVKAKVALVENHKMGGDCLNYGCVPSKALIKSAKMAHLTKIAKEYGVHCENSSIHFSQVMDRLRGVIQKIEPHDSVERYTQLGVDCFQDAAKIISPYEVQIGKKIFTTKNIVVATGARPFIPDFVGIQNINPLTSETLWELSELPKRLLVVGGGAIGCELAQAFQRLGSQVTLVEKGPHLLVRMDEPVGAFLQSALKREGVEVFTDSEVVEFKNGLVVLKSKEELHEVKFDKVLFALGRKARTEGFGLEELGIRLNNQGFIEHDEFLATRFPNIYVCGDCAGPYQQTHVAAHQAWYASLNSLFAPYKKWREDLRVIPSVIFTDPEIAHVGFTERELIEQKREYQSTQYEIADLDRAICEGDNRGFIKVLTSGNSDQILGATIVAANAGEVLAEIVFAMKHRLGLNKILATIHSYPTWAESNKYVAGQWKSKNAPVILLKWLSRFHRWRRS